MLFSTIFCSGDLTDCNKRRRSQQENVAKHHNALGVFVGVATLSHWLRETSLSQLKPEARSLRTTYLPLRKGSQKGCSRSISVSEPRPAWIMFFARGLQLVNKSAGRAQKVGLG